MGFMEIVAFCELNNDRASKSAKLVLSKSIFDFFPRKKFIEEFLKYNIFLEAHSFF